ncbi:MAG TPA: non-homologous end-joining DNA ligase [Propionicimonas sp.]|nr:non-homologous end-joining DNA ligase [Propionicimonas sp.]
MAAAGTQHVTVAGRTLALTNLDKVLYPATGTTKGEVIAYYAAIGDVLLPHLTMRPITRKRWPDGVGDGGPDVNVFFAKNLPRGTPDWVKRFPIEHSDGTNLYPIADDVATLVWLAQLASLELHVPQWRFADKGTPRNPDRLVLDLDPGPGVTLSQCAEVAGWVRDALRAVGLEPYPVTSGSKGIHLYTHLDGTLTPTEASALAKRLAEALQAKEPARVTAVMRRADRDGKVFLDWSQNNGNKTTITPYSLRGRAHPTVAAPRTWDELSRPGLVQLDFHEVLDRVAELGDLLAPLAGEPESRPARPAGVSPARPAGVSPARPMLATLATPAEVGSGDAWAFEMKWDGVRVLIEIEGEQIRLVSRSGRDETLRYPDLMADLRAIGAGEAILDGEIVVVDAGGAPRFELLQPRINLTKPADIAAAAQRAPVQLMLFDVLSLNGVDLTELAYEERRKRLEELPAQGRVQVPPGFEGDLAAALDTSLALGLEGVVAKRRGSAYAAGSRSRNWLKIKHRRTQSVVIGGWRPGSGNREGTIGSLLVGVPSVQGLRYSGRVGSGFSDAGLAEAQRLLRELSRAEPSLVDVPKEDAKDAAWVEPLLVGEVAYTERTSMGRLRHPVWMGWRTDLTPADVHPE